jgi:predicted NUDIX family NTP pyrophosphohydrolase
MPKLSAGLLLYRETPPDRLEVLLVHPGGPFWMRKDAHAWSIPKGEYLEGADAVREAEREFSEELGLPAPGGQRLALGSVRQSGGKIVQAWAVRVDDLDVSEVKSNLFEMEWPPRSGQMQSFPEVDRAEWMTVAEARDRMVAAQVDFLDRLLELVAG